jgi:hypothetical protein
MLRKQLLALAGYAGIAGMLLWAPAANAITVSVGLQETGTNGGAVTTVNSNTGASIVSAGVIGLSYGSFTSSTVTGTGLASPTDLLLSNSIHVSSGTAGTLNVFVTVQGLTTPLSSALSLISSFTSNVLNGSITSVTETTFISSTNALYAGAGLSSTVFSAIGTNVQTASGNTGAGTYSITEEFTIVATGSGNTNSSIDVSSATPIPAALPLFAGGLGVLGLLARRRKRKGIPALSAIA